MAYKLGQRNQMSMLPVTINDYIQENDPVRAYDAFIEAINIEKLGVIVETNKIGNPAYDPKAMLKLLVYGYSYGWRSSRKLERAVYHNLSFIWLVGGLKPDHKTIANFRKKNKNPLKELLKKCAVLCMQLGLIEGNTLFLDGSKIRANASINKTLTKENLEKKLKEIEETINQLLNECEKVDKEESGSLVRMKRIQSKEKMQAKIKYLVKRMEKEERAKKINSTDPECVSIKGRQGSHVGYNAQTVVDEKHGLIVNTDVVNKNNDMGQFSIQINKANEVLGKKCDTACADAGYAKTSDIKEIVAKKIKVIVPNQKQALHKPVENNPFSKDKFKYDKRKDCYICPEGQELKFSYYKKDKNHNIYRMRKKGVCTVCKYHSLCTKNKIGRSINRLKDEEIKEQLEEIYQTDIGQAIYKKRKEKAELPFGHIKRNLNGGAFLLRGLEGVNAEMSINATCFNIARMLTILGGVCPFIEKMAK